MQSLETYLKYCRAPFQTVVSLFCIGWHCYKPSGHNLIAQKMYLLILFCLLLMLCWGLHSPLVMILFYWQCHMCSIATTLGSLQMRLSANWLNSYSKCQINWPNSTLKSPFNFLGFWHWTGCVIVQLNSMLIQIQAKRKSWGRMVVVEAVGTHQAVML